MKQSSLIDISTGTILRIIAVLLGIWLLYAIRDVLLMLLAAIIIAFTIEPLAKRLQAYKVPRSVSVVVVYLAIIGLFVFAITLLLPVVAEETTQLAQQVPQLIHGLENTVGKIPGFSSDSIVPQLQDVIGKVGNNLTNLSSTLVEQTKTFFSGFLSLVFVFIIAFYLVIEEDALKKAFRYVVPKQHMAYVELMIDRIEYKLGRWVLAQLFLGLIIGVVISLVFWIFGIKYALALGLVAGILEIFPYIGPLLSGIVGTLIALSQSFVLGIIALIVYVVVQQLENHVLVPNIMKRATGLNPLVTLIAILLGGRFAGIIGIIFSVPIATIISILLADFFSTAAADDELAG